MESMTRTRGVAPWDSVTTMSSTEVSAASERGGDFQKQRGFADSRIAAKKKRRPANEAAAGNAVEFGNARGKPRRVLACALERLDGERAAFARGSPRAFGAFLNQRVPFAAGLTLARPARESGTAILANETWSARHQALR